MPIPKPNAGEEHDKYISRAMGDSTMNSEYPDTKQRYAVAQSEWERHLKKGFMVAKVNDDCQFVFGWANVAIRKDGHQIQDWQDDIVDIEDLEKAAYDFNLVYRETGEMHQGESVGKMIESFVVTKQKLEQMGLPSDSLPLGWWVGFHISSKEVFEKVKSGQYSMLSIQGTAKREEV